jgi:hypothetical protein
MHPVKSNLMEYSSIAAPVYASFGIGERRKTNITNLQKHTETRVAKASNFF